MDQEAADELGRGQAHDLCAITSLDAVVLPVESHGVAIGTDQPVVGDRNPMRISAEIGQHLLGPAKGWFGIDDPVGFAQRYEMGRECIWVGQSRQIAEECQLPRLVQLGQAFEEQTPEQSG